MAKSEEYVQKNMRTEEMAKKRIVHAEAGSISGRRQGKVHACPRLQADRGHAALAPPARRRHSPCLPGVVSIPGADQSSIGAGRQEFDLTGCLDFGDYYY